jgi:hypothetical protein
MGRVLAVEHAAQPFWGQSAIARRGSQLLDQECSRRVLIGKGGLDCTSFGSLVRRRFINNYRPMRKGPQLLPGPFLPVFSVPLRCGRAFYPQCVLCPPANLFVRAA